MLRRTGEGREGVNSAICKASATTTAQHGRSQNSDMPRTIAVGSPALQRYTKLTAGEFSMKLTMNSFAPSAAFTRVSVPSTGSAKASITRKVPSSWRRPLGISRQLVKEKGAESAGCRS